VKILHAIILLSISAMFAACVPLFEKPLSLIGEQAIDKKMLGVWKAKHDGETSYFHIGIANDGKSYDIYMLDRNNDSVKYSKFVGHNTKIENKTYINFKLTEKNAKVYLLARYEVDAETLKISIATDKVFKKAVRNGELLGNGKNDVTITDTTENTSQFIINNENEIFKETNVYKKVK